MGWRIPWGLYRNNAVFQYLIIGLAACQVCAMEVRTSSEVEAVNGSAATLSCTFTSSSSVTSLVSVDWSYKPQSGGPSQSVFYFYSTPHPPPQGQFKGRIRWVGNPSRGDCSILLLNATFTDNGTYTCSVKNPPDVHGAPSQVRLSVVPKKVTVRFNDVAVLMGLVLLPTVIIVPILLGRMWCHGKPCGVKRSKPACSPIEVKEHEANVYQNPPSKQKGHCVVCCELYFQDSDCEEDLYLHDEKQRGDETVAETGL
ncbi:hypothetical protein COCON_G00186850 [Conger conger]|uniref:Ig-like domain-containing protein n=1 Tax=Conger conger TaxID=82655 RepID=A0A9Q1HR43_CONCO|nr:myelin protein zero-like protein 3 [Conger conger]KAJ8256533.1 hypothetical protein COCON_G00186850 [Conger conger]